MTEPNWKTTGESPGDHYEDEAAIAAQEAWEETKADAMRKDARDEEAGGLLNGDIGGETYRWHTDEYHPDNSFTMSEFLEYHLPPEFEIVAIDGTYAEIKRNGFMYEVHASGDGDSFNHKVEFVAI